MKKILVIAALMLGFAAAAVAQPRAVGLRLGYGAEVSYQHTLGNNFIEADLGVLGFGANFNANAIYNFMIAQPQWTDRGEWGFYAGPGVALGGGGVKVNGVNYGYFNAGVAGQVGLEYTFWFPLQLSIDIRPQLGVVTVPNAGAAFYFDSWCPALSVRYRF